MSAKIIEFTKEEVHTLYDEYIGGVSAKKLGERYGVSRNTIRRRFNDCDLNSKEIKKLTITRTIDNNIQEIYEEYSSKSRLLKDIAKEYNVNMSTILKHFKKYGLSRNKSGKKLEFTKQEIDELYKKYLEGASSTDLCKKYDVDSSTILWHFKKHGLPIKEKTEYLRTYTINEHYFDNIDSEEKAYFFGMLMADGNNHIKHNEISLSLEQKDRYMVEKFNIAMESNCPVTKRCKPNSTQYGVKLHSKFLSKHLVEIGMVNAKSLILEFPTIMQNNKFQRDFIRGYFDGDGCLSLFPNKKSRFGKMCTLKILGTKNFLTVIQKILQENKIESKIYPVKNIFHLTVHKKKSLFLMLNYMYNNSKIYLERKYNKKLEAIELLKEQIKYNITHKGRAIK